MEPDAHWLFSYWETTGTCQATRQPPSRCNCRINVIFRKADIWFWGQDHQDHSLSEIFSSCTYGMNFKILLCLVLQFTFTNLDIHGARPPTQQGDDNTSLLHGWGVTKLVLIVTVKMSPENPWMTGQSHIKQWHHILFPGQICKPQPHPMRETLR